MGEINGAFSEPLAELVEGVLLSVVEVAEVPGHFRVRTIGVVGVGFGCLLLLLLLFLLLVRMCVASLLCFLLAVVVHRERGKVVLLCLLLPFGR